MNCDLLCSFVVSGHARFLVALRHPKLIKKVVHTFFSYYAFSCMMKVKTSLRHTYLILLTTVEASTSEAKAMKTETSVLGKLADAKELMVFSLFVSHNKISPKMLLLSNHIQPIRSIRSH